MTDMIGVHLVHSRIAHDYISLALTFVLGDDIHSCTRQCFGMSKCALVSLLHDTDDGCRLS